MDTTANRIKKALEIRDLKQADLVEMTGIGKSSISTYISGSYEPKQKNIYKISKALNVSEAWLMGSDVPMEKEPSMGSNDFAKLAKDSEELLSAYENADLHHKNIVRMTLGLETLDTGLGELASNKNHRVATPKGKSYLAPIAAHNDNHSDEQLELMYKDIERIKKMKK